MLLKVKYNATNMSRYYKIDGFHAREDAVRWLNNVKNINGFVTNYYYFQDRANRIDEGSGSIQLDANVSLRDMEQYVRNKSIDLIFINGKYNEKPVVVGVDLTECIVYMTERGKTPADIDALEKRLQLV